MGLTSSTATPSRSNTVTAARPISGSLKVVKQSSKSKARVAEEAAMSERLRWENHLRK